MKKTLTAFMVAFTLLVTSGGMSFAQDIQRGQEAYDAGDYAAAAKWYRKSAEQGDAGARFNLGFMYENGQGVTQDYKQAVKWYRKSAEQGDAAAQHNLGVMYDEGQGVIQDYKQSVKWYRKAAEQGQVFAQFNLGGMYGTGQGVIHDKVYAHMWWNIAASTGDTRATKNRDIVAKQMTSSQIAEAQKLARECVQKQFKGC